MTKEQRAKAWARYYAEHREQQIARASQWAKDNPERLSERRKARYAADPEHRAKVSEQMRESYQRNKAKRIAKAQAWAKANPDKRNAINNRRRALTRGAPGTLTGQEWIDLLERYGRRCAYCGAGGAMTQDHVTPLKQGGAHNAENVVPACKPCNSRKQARTPEQAGMAVMTPEELESRKRGPVARPAPSLPTLGP